MTEQILVLQRRFGINTLVLGVHWAGMPASLAMEQMQMIAETSSPPSAPPEGNAMKIGAVMFFTTDSMQPAALGRALEERGFELLWVPEHTHVPLTRLSAYPGGGPLPRPYYDLYDPFLALNAAAAATTTLKIGTGICLVVQRDPIVTAKLVSSHRPAFPRAVPVRRRQRLEPRRDRKPRHGVRHPPQAGAGTDRGDADDLDKRRSRV